LVGPSTPAQKAAIDLDRKAAGVTHPATRMLVVGKGYVDRSGRPPELQGQEGFLF
jgi:hypothetical protein